MANFPLFHAITHWLINWLNFQRWHQLVCIFVSSLLNDVALIDLSITYLFIGMCFRGSWFRPHFQSRKELQSGRNNRFGISIDCCLASIRTCEPPNWTIVRTIVRQVKSTSTSMSDVLAGNRLRFGARFGFCCAERNSNWKLNCR